MNLHRLTQKRSNRTNIVYMRGEILKAKKWRLHLGLKKTLCVKR